MDKLSSKKQILLVLGFSLILLFQHSWVEGFFFDGYLYSALGKHAATNGRWLVPFLSDSHYANFDQHPPFLFMIMGIFFKIFGSSFTSARIFGSLWTFFSLMLMLWIIYRKNGSRNNLLYFIGISFLLNIDLIKKSRFPGLDAPLMFFFTACFITFFMIYSHLRIKQKSVSFFYWLLFGALFGVALLIKGPPALFIPFGIFIFLILKKDLKFLMTSWLPWFALIFGCLIFSLWPIALKLNGSFYIFERYFDNQFVRTLVKGRGKTSVNYLTYVKQLFVTSIIPTVFAIFGFYKFRKKISKNDIFDSFFLLCASWFLAVLIPMSFMAHKYSHYLLPLYPPLSFMAAYGINELRVNIQKKIINVFSVLLIIVNFIFLIFPVGIKTKRSVDLINLKKIIELKSIKPPKHWYMEKNSYPKWDMINFVGYIYSASVHEFNPDQIEKKLEGLDYGTIIVTSNKNLKMINQINYEVLYKGEKCKCTFLQKVN